MQRCRLLVDRGARRLQLLFDRHVDAAVAAEKPSSATPSFTRPCPCQGTPQRCPCERWQRSDASHQPTSERHVKVLGISPQPLSLQFYCWLRALLRPPQCVCHLKVCRLSVPRRRSLSMELPRCRSKSAAWRGHTHLVRLRRSNQVKHVRRALLLFSELLLCFFAVRSVCEGFDAFSGPMGFRPSESATCLSFSVDTGATLLSLPASPKIEFLLSKHVSLHTPPWTQCSMDWFRMPPSSTRRRCLLSCSSREVVSPSSEVHQKSKTQSDLPR